MTSILAQMSLLFSGGKTTKPEEQKSPSPKRPSHKRRDPLLEACARQFVLPLAPALSPLIVAGWNARMRTTAGVAIAEHWEIWLNPALRTISEDEVEKTLLHELAHLVARHRHGRRRIAPHGHEWRQACHDLGIPDEKRTHQLPFEGRKLKRRYQLRCPGCGESHARVRLPKKRIACLACCRLHHAGRYHERFRFEVIKMA